MNKTNILQRMIANLMSERQAKVYLALLTNGDAGPSDLQRASGIPLSKISETVNYLLSNGYINARKVGRKRIYQAVDPEIAMKSNIARLESKIETLKELTKDIVDIYRQSGQSSEIFEYIEIVHGTHNIHNKYLELLKSVESEFISFTRPPFAAISKEMLLEQEKVVKDLFKRGVKFRGVYEANEDSGRTIFQHILNSIENDADFRIAPKLPMKMVIFDQKTILFADKSTLSFGNEMSQTAIKQQTTVDGYVTLFEFFWEQALEYEEWIKDNKELMERKLALDSQ